MVPTHFTTLIDEALERFGSRDLVSGSEIVDFLLDLRLVTLADEIPSFPPAEPAPSHS